MLWRPGSGKNVRPCGPRPTVIVVMSRPVFVETTETVSLNRFEAHSCVPLGDTLISIGRPPTATVPVTFILRVSTRTTIPLYSQLTRRYRPVREKSRWSTPGHGMDTCLSSRHVCGSRNSIRLSYSATTMAFDPSGVKYRLYGLATGIERPRFPVLGSMTWSRSLPALSTYRWRRFHDGVTWWGWPPTVSSRTTRNVFGSISSTVPSTVFGT